MAHRPKPRPKRAKAEIALVQTSSAGAMPGKLEPLINAKPPSGKLGAVVVLLRRPEGATVAQLAAATDWQAHSVRGALAGALKKHGMRVTSEKTEAGRVYRLPASVTVTADEPLP